MNRKVTDIFPPKETEKKEVEEIIIEKESKPRIKKPKIKPAVPSSFKKVLIPVLSILILGGAFAFFVLSKADIEIWPETDTLSSQTKLTIDKNIETANLSEKVIPGRVFEKEKTITENFTVSGESFKEEKAEGIIRVYNAYSTYDQPFVANTRFVSADGQTFRTPSRVTIPGGHYEGGKLVPGEIDIRVVADQPGPEYNVEPTTFSIPGLAGTEKYTKFYAKSFESMTGGLRDEVNEVTEDDLKEAEKALTQKAKSEAENVLKNELESGQTLAGFNYLSNAIETEVTETFTLVKVGDTADNFNFQVKAKSQTLLYKNEDLVNFAKEYLLSQISDKTGQKIYEESLEISSAPETINLAGGKIVLSLDISATIYSDVNVAGLKSALMGKSLLESKIFLENQPEITRAKVEFWPFWVKTVPEKADKIEVKLNID